jgi:hypothetical protein
MSNKVTQSAKSPDSPRARTSGTSNETKKKKDLQESKPEASAPASTGVKAALGIPDERSRRSEAIADEKSKTDDRRNRDKRSDEVEVRIDERRSRPEVVADDRRSREEIRGEERARIDEETPVGVMTKRSSRASPRSRAKLRASANGSTNEPGRKAIETLNNHGFEVTENLMVADEAGNTRVATLKVANCLGQTAFVQIDDPNTLFATTTKDLTLIEIQAISTISEAERLGNYKTAGSSVTGVALVCENNVCMMVNDGDPEEPRERNFVYVASSHPKSAVLEGGTPIAYPVVRLSEIVANPNMVLKNINEATCRLRDRLYEVVMKEMRERAKDDSASPSMKNAIDELLAEHKAFTDCLGRKMKGTKDILCQLEAFQVHYIENPPKDEICTARMKAMTVLLRRWNEMYVDELRAAIVAAEQKQHIVKAASNFRSLRTYMEKEYDDLVGEMQKLSIKK